MSWPHHSITNSPDVTSFPVANSEADGFNRTIRRTHSGTEYLASTACLGNSNRANGSGGDTTALPYPNFGDMGSPSNPQDNYGVFEGVNNGDQSKLDGYFGRHQSLHTQEHGPSQPNRKQLKTCIDGPTTRERFPDYRGLSIGRPIDSTGNTMYHPGEYSSSFFQQRTPSFAASHEDDEKSYQSPHLEDDFKPKDTPYNHNVESHTSPQEDMEFDGSELPGDVTYSGFTTHSSPYHQIIYPTFYFSHDPSVHSSMDTLAIHHPPISPEHHSTYSELSANVTFLMESSRSQTTAVKEETRTTPLYTDDSAFTTGQTAPTGDISSRSPSAMSALESPNLHAASKPLGWIQQEDVWPSPQKSKSGPRSSKSSASKKRDDKRLNLACLFCRERKIACGRPAEGSPDQTCNQCSRRSFKCEYPTESRRGQHRRPKKDIVVTAHSDQ